MATIILLLLLAFAACVTAKYKVVEVTLESEILGIRISKARNLIT